jgi:type I restriction enzyme M protein
MPVTGRDEAGETGNFRTKISAIAGIYHSWRSKESSYSDIAGLCKSAAIGDVTLHEYILNPGHYVDIPEESESDIPFEQQWNQMVIELINLHEEGKVISANQGKHRRI